MKRPARQRLRGGLRLQPGRYERDAHDDEARVGSSTFVVRADERERLEHLCKYVLRPPLADRRLRLLATGEVA